MQLFVLRSDVELKLIAFRFQPASLAFESGGMGHRYFVFALELVSFGHQRQQVISSLLSKLQ